MQKKTIVLSLLESKARARRRSKSLLVVRRCAGSHAPGAARLRTLVPREPSVLRWRADCQSGTAIRYLDKR